MQERNIFADYSADLQLFLIGLTDKSMRDLSGKPNVKSWKMSKLSLSGMTVNLKTGKTTDPSC